MNDSATYLVRLPNGLVFGVEADSAQAALDALLAGTRFAGTRARRQGTSGQWTAAIGEGELVIDRTDDCIRTMAAVAQRS